MDDLTSAGIGRPGTRLFLSHKVKDSEESDGRISREGTMQSKRSEMISDLSKSVSPALWSFVWTASSAGDNISLKDKETVQQSLLLAQDKGKKRRGSQELSSKSGDNRSHIVLFTPEQRLHNRALRVCKDFGVASPCAQHQLYLFARDEVVVSMQDRGIRNADEGDEGFDDHFMDALK